MALEGRTFRRLVLGSTRLGESAGSVPRTSIPAERSLTARQMGGLWGRFRARSSPSFPCGRWAWPETVVEEPPTSIDEAL